MELPRDAEAVAGDEDAIEDDRRAGRIEGDALGLERGRPDRAPELARLAPSETHRGDRLVRAPDDDPERALERLVERRAGEVCPDDLVADERGKERALQAHRMVVHQPQPRDHEHPRAGPEAERVGDGAVRSREPHGKEPRRDVLALGREVPGEAAELEDVVIDRRRRHERPEAVSRERRHQEATKGNADRDLGAAATAYSRTWRPAFASARAQLSRASS